MIVRKSQEASGKFDRKCIARTGEKPRSAGSKYDNQSCPASLVMHFYRHGRKVPAQQSFRQGQNRITANRLAEEIALAEQPVAYHFHPISACLSLSNGAIGSYGLFVKGKCAAKLPAVSADAVFLFHRIAGRTVSPIEWSNVSIKRCPINFSGGIGRYCPGVSAPDAQQSANRRR